MSPGSDLQALRLTLRLTPHGRLALTEAEDAGELAPDLAERLRESFARGSGHGLLRLGGGELGVALPPVFAYWREFGSRYVASLCMQPDLEDRAVEPPQPPEEGLEQLAFAAPAMPGAEYLTVELLRRLWIETHDALAAEREAAACTVQDLLKRLNPTWNVVGRVHFNLAENRKDAEAPFAFLATYTSRLSAHGKAQHLPIGQALREYAGESKRDRLLSLLLPVQRAAAQCPWLREMIDSGELFHPLRWTPREALALLHDVPKLEASGVIVRMPANWKANRPPRPQVTARIGGKAPSRLGGDALLDFRVELTLDGERLTAAEMREILSASDGLALIRGQWVEVDGDRLARMMEQFQSAERIAARGGLSFAEAMRMLSGADLAGEDPLARPDADWSRVVAGPWLAETLQGLRTPDGLARVDPGRDLKGLLRPYQQVGVRWLHLLSNLGLGACLADDMGLGKTIQVLALLLVNRREEKAKRLPSLLVAPASLLANWGAEIERFAPSLRVMIAHPSAMPSAELAAMAGDRLSTCDLVITSYASLLRYPWLNGGKWRFAILDEAQAIKNPGAKQTRAAKKIVADARIALTGTPIENRLGDLWSIFDFINPGLLGTAKEFAAYAKRIAENPHNPYGPLRDLVRPYILRRLKTDRSVISDLPEKTEMRAFCHLSRKQAALYQQAVQDLARQIEAVEGIQRRGVVLAALMRFKQICNHPSQWLGDGAWSPTESGKWARLRDIVEVIAARQEKVLVFTQFREVTGPLSAYLGELFGRPGLVMHGQTEITRRREFVQRFQEDESVPFFVLSLKVGGSGLNLTAASHVIHFDRWWNPAVENQATDRAFRIGQTKNVVVHKFVCRGTVEEKIDDMIESKKQLSRDLLEGGAEINLTELRDEELLRLVALDLSAAARE